MTTYRSLNHTKWHCQYHVVFIPKYRRKAMLGMAYGGFLRRRRRVDLQLSLQCVTKPGQVPVAHHLAQAWLK